MQTMEKLDRNQRETVRNTFRKHPLWQLCRDVAKAWDEATHTAPLSAEELLQTTAQTLENIFESGGEAIGELPLLWHDIQDDTDNRGAAMTFTAAALALAAMSDEFYRLDVQTAMTERLLQHHRLRTLTPAAIDEATTCARIAETVAGEVAEMAAPYDKHLRQWLENFCENDHSLTEDIHNTLHGQMEQQLPAARTIPLNNKQTSCRKLLALYTFEKLPMLINLDDEQKAEIYRRLCTDAAYGAAMLQHLGFHQHLKESYGCNSSKIQEVCAAAVGCAKSTYTKYYSSLQPASNGNYEKNDASIHTESVRQDYKNIANHDF